MTARQKSQTKFNRFLMAGDSGVVVSFADEEPDIAVAKARALAHVIRAGGHGFSDAVLDVIPGMNSVIIQYDSIKISSTTITEETASLLPRLSIDEEVVARHWQIPVLYGGDGGPDLEDVAAKTQITPDEVISRHLARTLTVAMMGFMPGLGYLKGVDETLYLPRRLEPRKVVPALTLGIAMDQSVIYPLESPGGWHLIGKVPVRVFDRSHDDPVLFRPSDRVSFRQVNEAEFNDLDVRARMGELPISEILKGKDDA